MTTLTAAQCMADRPAESPAFGRSPLRLLLLLSLALHAAAIGLWPEAAAVITEPLPAGPIALRLQNAAAGSRATARAEAATQSAAKTIDTERKEHARPRKAELEPAPRRAQHATAHEPIRPPAVVHDSVPASMGIESPARDTRAATATGAERGDELREQLRSRLNNALIAHFDYPLTARRRGWEGVVRVGLRVEANGRLTRLHVIGSSGHAVLDRAALNSLGRVGRLPDAISWLQGRQFDMVLPVRYQLIDS